MDKITLSTEDARQLYYSVHILLDSYNRRISIDPKVLVIITNALTQLGRDLRASEEPIRALPGRETEHNQREGLDIWSSQDWEDAISGHDNP